MSGRQTIKQLGVLMKMAKHSEDIAAKGLKDAQSKLLLAKQTYEQLGQYALQYHHHLIDKSTETAQSGLSWQQNTQFLASLDRSKRLQVQKIAEEERNVQLKRHAWLAQHLNRKKIEILLNKQKDKLELELNRKEQRELNDLINQYHMRASD
jgi:flagellar export protein FliJ